MEAQPHRFGIFCSEAGFHDFGPTSPRSAELSNLLEEIALRHEIKGKPRRELVDVHASLEHLFDIDDAIGERDSGFLPRRRTGFGDMVAGNIDRVVAPHVRGAVSDAVAHDAHGRRYRIAEFLLRYVFL